MVWGHSSSQGTYNWFNAGTPWTHARPHTNDQRRSIASTRTTSKTELAKRGLLAAETCHCKRAQISLKTSIDVPRLGTVIKQNGDGLLEESHMPVGWPLHIDGAVRQRCVHRDTTLQELDDLLGEYDMKRDLVEINRKAPQWAHKAVWNKLYMEPNAGFALHDCGRTQNQLSHRRQHALMKYANRVRLRPNRHVFCRSCNTLLGHFTRAFQSLTKIGGTKAHFQGDLEANMSHSACSRNPFFVCKVG